MSTKYEVSIESTGNENIYRITWYNEAAETRDYFDTSADEISAKELEILWQYPHYQAGIGEKLFRFLDGNSRFLQRALDEAEKSGEILELALRPKNATADWPFELLARDGGFLLHDRIHLVRRISDWGEKTKIPPANRMQRLLFHESGRVGSWILKEKKQELHTVYDAALLDEIAVTMKELNK